MQQARSGAAVAACVIGRKIPTSANNNTRRAVRRCILVFGETEPQCGSSIEQLAEMTQANGDPNASTISSGKRIC
jgi:hypothetical protein